MEVRLLDKIIWDTTYKEVWNAIHNIGDPSLVRWAQSKGAEAEIRDLLDEWLSVGEVIMTLIQRHSVGDVSR